MKVSLNWLKKYVDIDVAPEVLCEKMTAQGFEVESMEKSSVMSNVVTAKIKQIQRDFRFIFPTSSIPSSFIFSGHRPALRLCFPHSNIFRP